MLLIHILHKVSSIQFIRSVVSDSLPPMNCSTPSLPIHHQLPESTQTHVHWVGDAIQPSHPLSSPSPLAFSLSQFFQMSQLFTLGGQSIGVSASTSVLPMNTQDSSPLGWTGWISLSSQGLKSLLQHHSSKAVLGCNLKNDRMTPVHFQGKPFNITVIQVYTWPVMLKKLKLNGSMKTYETF